MMRDKKTCFQDDFARNRDTTAARDKKKNVVHNGLTAKLRCNGLTAVLVRLNCVLQTETRMNFEDDTTTRLLRISQHWGLVKHCRTKH